jgi:hypothetical protein
MVKNDVGPAGRAFLECLSKPRKVEDVVRQLAGSHNIDIDAELRSATEKALVFQEDGWLACFFQIRKKKIRTIYCSRWKSRNIPPMIKYETSTVSKREQPWRHEKIIIVTYLVMLFEQ